LHVKNLARIKKFVHDFTRDGALTIEQRNYYDSIVAFTKGDDTHFHYFTNQLSGEYTAWKQTIAHIQENIDWLQRSSYLLFWWAYCSRVV
jgi:hypothetical protein